MIFKEQLTNISTVLNNTGNTTKLLTSFSALDASQQKVLLSSKLLTEEQKEQCIVMSMLSSANTKYTAEQLSKTAGISAETLANWGLTSSTDTLTVSELAEKAATDAQAKSALEKIVAQNAQAVANGELTASNVTLTASETGTTLATGAFTTAIKANILAMKTWLLTTPAGWITMLVGGIFLAVKAYDALTVSVEEQKEKMEDSLSAYSDAKSELENITTELDNQKQAMDELLGKEKLTYAEKGQLEELQQITEELRIQKDLAEKEESRTQKEVASDAATLFKKQFGKYDISDEAIDEYQTNANATGNNAILVSDENDLSAMIAGYKQFNDLLDEAYGEKNQEDIDHFVSLTEDLKDSIFSTAQDLQTQQDNMSDYYNTIKNVPYDELTSDQKEVVDAYTAISNAIALIYKELDPNSWNEMQIDKLFTTDGIEKTKDELVEMAKEGTLDESTIQSYSKLNSTLEDSNMILNDGQSAASALCDEMYALADAEDDVQSSKLNETPISSTDILAQVQALSTGLDQLDKIYADVYNKEDFDWSSILNNDGFKEAFGNMTNVTEDYKNAYDDFIKTISNNPADLSACQSAFDNLATAYIYNSDALKNVTEETKASTIAMLNQMGIVNAAEVVNYRLGASESYAADTGKDLESATLSEITAFAKEADMSDITKASLAAYVTEKIHAASITITTSADINNLTALCSQLGVAGTALAQFARLKAIAMDTSGKYTDGYKEYATTAADQILQNAVNAAQTKYTPQFGGGSATKKAVNDAAKAAKDAAKDVKEAVAETFDFIENGINRFDRALSKLEDKAGKTSSSFTSRLNAYKEALNATTFGIELLTDDYNKYMQKANEVGLNEDIASAVRGGASNIWDYTDDTVKQQIKDYQNWYDKAQDCLDKIDELKDKQLELTQASIELLITQYEKLSTKVENANDRMEKWISLKESWGFSANTKNYNSMNKNIQKQIDYINKQDEQLKLLQKTVTKGSEAWYEYNERIDSNKASLIELKQQMQENATAAAVLAKATADKKTEKYDSQDELYDAKIDNATSAKSKNKLIDKKISNINKTQKAYNTAVSTDNKNLKSAKKTISKFKSTKENKKILASIKKAAKAGKRISQSLLDKASKLNDNGRLYNACVQYNAYWDAKQSDKATADLYKETAKQDKADLAKEKFDNISSDYDNKISSNEQKKTALNNKISLAQEQISAAYYKSLISSEKGEKNKLIKERKDLQKNLNDAVIKGSIKKGSDEWYEMVSAINEVTNAIDESTQSIVEYQNALRQLKWDAFDKSMETVKRINSENDYYIDLMSHKDMTDKDTGNFTKYGTATIGLHKTNYDNYLAQADEYQREYNKIMRQIEKGELSLSDENVVQRLRDLQDAHRDAKKSAEDELQSIQDLVKQGYEAQTDALSELIDKYKKLKDSELEAYKYQKEIAEKTKTIASLQKQLTAYNGNDSEESRAQIQKLKVQLEEAKSDLKDTQYEKFISDTEDMLDDLMTDYQKFIDEKLNDTNTILDEIKTLLGSDIIETIKGLDSNLTNDTKDQIGSSTTNGGDGGQAAKDYVHNTVTNDQNKVNSKTDTSSYDPAKEADIAKKKNGIAQKKKAINGQRQSFQNQIKELESQLKQLYGELNSIENKYQFEKSSTKNKDKLQDLKNNYIEKKSGLNAMIQDVTHNKDVLQQFIADLDKQSAQLDTDLVSLKGYEKGSEHIDKCQLAWTQENKRELIYRAADGALLTELNPGDKVFTNEMTENLWKMAQMNPAQMYAGQFTPVTPDFSKSVNNSSNIEVTFGDLVLPDVTNSAEFADSVESVMREAICRNGKTTQCITEAVSAKQLGKNRNSIGNARLYK